MVPYELLSALEVGKHSDERRSCSYETLSVLEAVQEHSLMTHCWYREGLNGELLYSFMIPCRWRSVAKKVSSGPLLVLQAVKGLYCYRGTAL